MSQDSEFVDVTYRGLKVAHKARFRDVTADGGFVEVEAPLPVGAIVQIVRDGKDPKDGRVAGVIEQEAGAKSAPGMRISWGSAAQSARPAAPAPVAEVTSAPPEDGAPVEEMDAGSSMSMPIEGDAGTSQNGKKKRGKKKK